MSLPQTFGLRCRACGAPRPLAAEGCEYCGETGRLGADAVRRLKTHRARLRRALGELRTVLAFQVDVVTGQKRRVWIALAFLVTALVPVFAGIALVVLALGVGEGGGLVLGAGLVAVALAGVGITAAVGLLYFLLKRIVARSARLVRTCAPDLAATVPVRCAHCGGHAAAVALGPDASLPCPWCDSELVPASDLGPALRASSDALVAHQRELGRELQRESLAQVGQAARSPRLPIDGFEMRSGLVKGRSQGVTLWSGLDIVDGRWFARVEVPIQTGVDAEHWFVRPEEESRLRAAAGEWGYELPTRATDAPVAGVLAYADADAPPLSSLMAAVGRLGPRDALLIDPAGLSVWRHRKWPIAAAWKPLSQHRETLVALARELSATGTR